MYRPLSWALLPALALAALGASAQENTARPAPPAPREIHGMRYPAVSPDGSRIAFSYRGDLWTVPTTGGEAKRVAELPGWDVRARWSPDGKTLAFSTDRNGNLDLYTIPAEGGTPTQVTFNTADDLLSDWSPDGKSLLFYSARDTRFSCLYTVRLEDGRIQELARDDQSLQSAAYAPDGKSVVYVRGGSSWARKSYQGSAEGDLYTVSTSGPDLHPRRLTSTPFNEMWPLYAADGKWVYYVANTEGSGNLWRMPARGGKPAQVTREKAHFIHYPSISRDGKTIAYETEFSLWTVNPSTSGAHPKQLTVTASVVDNRKVENQTFTRGATEFEASPDGTQVALGLRGDIFLLPATGGEAKRLTDSPARDYDFTWSPDGRYLAFVSDRDANTDLYLLEVATGATRRLTSDPAPETSPQFSPDGRYLAFLRGAGGRMLVVMPVGGGPERVVVDSGFIGSPNWSPDGKWLAYTRRALSAATNVYVRRVDGSGDEINISRWTGVNSNPVWSADGKRLLFTSSRSGSPELYSAELRKPGVAATQVSNTGGEAFPEVSVDPAGIDRRVKPFISGTNGDKRSVAFTPDGKSALFTIVSNGESTLYSVSATGGSAKKVLDGLGGAVQLSHDGSTLFGMNFGRLRKAKVDGGKVEEIAYSAVMPVDPREERRQTFDQAWRMLHDFFYDAKMHGADWEGVRRRYRPVVDECVDVQDFYLLLAELIGELNASHLGVSAINPPRQRDETGYLGLWFDWSHAGPGLKVRDVVKDGPADIDSTHITPGEYVLAVDGKDVAPTEAFWKLLAGKSRASVELLVNTRPDKTGARTVKLQPVTKSALGDLLYEDLVQRRREAVDRLSGGKLAYLHIRQMNPASLQRFDRELITEAYDKDGLVLDVRNNPGGRIHDELFALLTRKVHVYETPRDGLKMTQPFGAFTRPMVLLINQGSFSDSEIFANGFRYNGLGKIVGVPTGGGVIGTVDMPLLDGQTRFRIPRTGWQTVDGRNLENWGVPPDAYVELSPDDALAGRDPQLERAVTEMLKQLRASGRGAAKK